MCSNYDTDVTLNQLFSPPAQICWNNHDVMGAETSAPLLPASEGGKCPCSLTPAAIPTFTFELCDAPPIQMPGAKVEANQKETFRISLGFNGDLMQSKPNLSNSSLQDPFGRGQIVLLPLRLWDHCGSVNPQPPVVVSCSASLQRAFLNCLCDQKRLLRRSDSISAALLGLTLN